MWLKNALTAADKTAPDNVVSLEPSRPHEPPRKWGATYKAASEQRAYVEKLEADFAEFLKDSEARMAGIAAERVQRQAAIQNAVRQLEDLQNEILVMAANVGINVEGRQS